MRKKALKLFGFFILVLTLLSPTLAFAHSYYEIPRGQVFLTNDQIFRLRNSTKPWQLSSFADKEINESQIFQDQIYLSTVNPGQVYRSTDGITYQLVSELGSGFFIFKVISSQLLVFENTNHKLFILKGDSFHPLLPSLLQNADELQRIVLVGSELISLKQSQDLVVINLLDNLAWLQQGSFNCPGSIVFTDPFVFTACQNGDFYFPSSAVSWLPQNLPPIVGVKVSNNLIIGQSPTDPSTIYILENEQLNTILLNIPPGETLRAVELYGSRLIIRFSSGLFELLWNQVNPELVSLGGDGKIVDPNDGQTIFYQDNQSQISTDEGFWQPITTSGVFNHATSTPGGYFLWQTEDLTGGLAQYADIGSFNFVKVNPWSSTTSPIQATNFGPTGYLSVITQSGSGNVNLYKTTNYRTWSRVTLPTKPTSVVTISEARSLVSGQLIETLGVLSVLPGVVESQVSYIQDNFSGIQVYLSSAKGNLPQIVNKQVRVTGEISSSQAKRIGLADLSELEILDSALIERQAISANEATTNLGLSVNLTGIIDSLDTDLILMKNLVNNLKIHFNDSRSKLYPNDDLILPVVIDWNSGSDAVEAWSLDGSFTLVFRQNSTTAPTLSSKITPSTTKPKTSLEVKKATQPTTKLASNNQTLVQAAQFRSSPKLNAKSSSPTIAITAAAFVTGLLISRGRRFTFKLIQTSKN